MRKIPDALREQMDRDPYMHRCAITGVKNEKIDWHHNLIYGGKQVNEPWAIIPLARSVHEKIQLYQDKVDWIMLCRATDDELRPYCKVINYIRRRDILIKKYGDPRRLDRFGNLRLPQYASQPAILAVK